MKKKKKSSYGHGDAGRCMKSAAKKTYGKKRKYHPPKNKKEAVAEAPSTSHKKIVEIESNERGSQEYLDGYRLIHFEALQQLIGGLVLCPECYGENLLHVDSDVSKRKGLASFIIITCRCGYPCGEYTSPVIKPANNATRGGGGGGG